MPNLTLNHADLFFIWDTLNDRRVNCLDLVESDISIDADTSEDLMDTAAQADRLQDIITIAMQED